MVALYTLIFYILVYCHVRIKQNVNSTVTAFRLDIVYLWYKFQMPTHKWDHNITSLHRAPVSFQCLCRWAWEANMYIYWLLRMTYKYKYNLQVPDESTINKITEFLDISHRHVFHLKQFTDWPLPPFLWRKSTQLGLIDIASPNLWTQDRTSPGASILRKKAYSVEPNQQS
jgi:hypothetical protein